MARRTRWILLALLVLVIGGGIALVVVQRPKLDDARTKVDTTWKPLRGSDQLVLRYQTLASALTAFDAAGGKDRAVSTDLHAALATWQRSLRDGDAGAQAEAANAVEAQGTRLASNALGSQRISADKAVTDSLTKYAQTQPNPAFVSAYNRAVRAYEDRRTETLAKPAARVLGFGARPVLQLGVGAAAGG